jgi:tripartite-type tricarboxylate transporter receptor subunit TctC
VFKSRIVNLLGIAFVSVALLAAASAQDFPSRPIKLIIGFGAGGLGDVSARLVMQKMSASLGKPIIVENMPGPGGMAAAAAAARAAPDGHTMLWVSGQNAISPSIFKSLPYKWSALEPVTTVGVFDFVIVVDKTSPLKTVGDVIAAAKANPDKFNIGTISVGSAQYLMASLFQSMAGIKATIVPFRTTGELVTALISKQIQVVFETVPGVIGQVRGGALRAVGISSAARVPFLPDVPTVAESGVPAYKISSWNGIVVPAKTPRDIVLRLNKEIASALAVPEVNKRYLELGIDPRTSTPEELQKIYQTDVERWRKVIADANIPKQ